MINIIPKKLRYFSDMWNMNSHFLFSFAEYYDPYNQSFWKLRVFNDDYLQWNSWFEFHPHKHYEILTLMLDWTITHKDNLWNTEKISKNEIQVTDTANWIMHSEINAEDRDLSLYQIWFSPDETSKKPIYYKSKYQDKDLENNLYQIASWIDENAINKLTSKVEILRWIFDENKIINLNFKDYIFIYVTNWAIEVNWKKAWEKDQVRIFWEENIDIKFLKKSDIVVIYSK